MSIKAKSWLPSDALSPDRLKPVLDRVFNQWGEHWFAGARAIAEPAFQDDWPRSKSDALWRSCPPIASIALTQNGQAVVAGAMLGSNVPQATLQAGDRLIVERLASQCVDDLLKRLGGLVKATATIEIGHMVIDLDDCSWWEVSVGARRNALKLALARSAAIDVVKLALPAPTSSQLGSLASSLEKQRVELAAELGRCAISLADLQHLSIGDVLVLDRSAAAPLDLLINGCPSPLRASLDASDDRAAFILADSRKVHHV